MNYFTNKDFEIFDDLLSKAPTNFLKDSLQKDSIFHMHIPKTGGTYVNMLFRSLKMLPDPNLPHGRCNPNILLYPDPTDSIPSDFIYTKVPGFNKSLKFCVIRNPFDWLTSYYFHSHGVVDVPWDGVHGVGGIRYYYRTFEEFVEGYCNDEKYWNPGLSEFRAFYPFQIFDEYGKCRADFIMKNGCNSELNSACILLAASFGVPPTLTKDRGSKKQHTSPSKKKMYQDYYTPRLIAMLEKKWEGILGALGYNFLWIY